MKEQITDLVELQKAIDNEETIVNESGEHLIGSNTMRVNLFTGGLMVNLYIKTPDPEPARYVYRELKWDGFYPMVEVDYNYTNSVVLPAHIGLGHWENNHEYRLCRFTQNKINEEIGRSGAYDFHDGKMRYARFELQIEETE